MSPTIHLAALGKATTMHHVVAPKPLPRGRDPEQVRTRCGLSGAPRVLLRHIDANAIRVREGVVCGNCLFPLNGGA